MPALNIEDCSGKPFRTLWAAYMCFCGEGRGWDFSSSRLCEREKSLSKQRGCESYVYRNSMDKISADCTDGTGVTLFGCQDMTDNSFSCWRCGMGKIPIKTDLTMCHPAVLAILGSFIFLPKQYGGEFVKSSCSEFPYSFVSGAKQ